MRIVCSTHQGVLYNDELDYVLIHNDKEGEFTIMENHVPIVSVMDSGYIKLVRDKDELFIVVTAGIIEFHDNVATVLCQEAQIGKTSASAMTHLKETRKEHFEKNKIENVESTKKEQELYENIKNSGAGKL